MENCFRKLVVLAAFLACTGMASAQLPNEKFGKPSSMEWEFNGWGDATDADAIILCKTMAVSYQLSDQVFNSNRSDTDLSTDNISDFGKNDIDDSNILVKYDVKLRTKILKPDGAKHANIDITYFDCSKEKKLTGDVITDLKIKVFTRNEKGKVEKKSVSTDAFVRERVNDDYMVLHVVVPDVQPGSIVEYQYSITSNRPAFLYDWVFQESIPTVHTKCDIEVPAILQFKMNVPINKLIKSGVEVGHLAYDTNRADLKKGKTCPTNHYKITGDYILPEGYELKHNQSGSDGKPATMELIAPFTSQITTPVTTLPAAMPQGSTHLKVQ